MAVLIKNFDMPHDCNACPIHKIWGDNQYVEYIICKVTGKKLNQKLYYLARDCDCPLLPSVQPDDFLEFLWNVINPNAMQGYLEMYLSKGEKTNE